MIYFRLRVPVFLVSFSLFGNEFGNSPQSGGKWPMFCFRTLHHTRTIIGWHCNGEETEKLSEFWCGVANYREISVFVFVLCFQKQWPPGEINKNAKPCTSLLQPKPVRAQTQVQLWRQNRIQPYLSFPVAGLVYLCSPMFSYIRLESRNKQISTMNR